MAIVFDGSTQYGQANLGFGQPTTWSFWYKPEVSVSQCILSSANITAGGNSTLFRAYHLSDGRFQIIRGTTGAATTANTATLNSWNHGIAVFNSVTSRTAQLNGGTAVTNTTNVTSTSSTAVTFGAFQTNLGVAEYFDGAIAEVGMWSTNLTADERLLLSKGISPLFVRPESLILYCPMITNTTPQAELKQGNNLTLTGSPSASDHPRIYYPAMPFVWADVAASTPPTARIPRTGVTMLTSPIGIV